MPAKKGDKVKVDYVGTLDDGTVFDTSTHDDHSHPIEFEVGAGTVIKGFDDAVMGMNKGEEKSIRIQSKDAYGDPNPQLIQTIPRKSIPLETELKPGTMLALGTPDGHKFPATVKSVNDAEVTLDLNHPLAGKNLNFKIKLSEII